jgi:hypothetical protein
MGNKSQGYEVNEKDIDTVIEFLENYDPENATPETAISILEHLKASVHELAHTNPDLLTQIYEDLKNQKQPEEKTEEESEG